MATLLLLLASFTPLTASAEFGSNLGRAATRSSNSDTLLAAQAVDFDRVCGGYADARTSDFATGESTLLTALTAEYPLPGATRDALIVLSDDTSSATARNLARVAVTRFFSGACNSGTDGSRSACTILVTLRVAQPIQIERLASQMRFVLHNNPDSSVALDEALEVLAAPIDSTTEEAYEAATNVVLSETAALCDNLDSAPTASTDTSNAEDGTAATEEEDPPAEEDAPEPAPESLPSTGLGDVAMELVRYALIAIGFGAALLGERARRHARIKRPLPPWAV